MRDEVRAVHGTSELPGWEQAIDDDLVALVAAGELDEARARVRASLKLGEPAS